jgi:hypothetical protein
MVGQVTVSLLDANWLSLVCLQGILMLQDQYRAVMHFSIPKETQIERNAQKSSQDWICIKVRVVVVVVVLAHILVCALKPSFSLSLFFFVCLKVFFLN